VSWLLRGGSAMVVFVPAAQWRPDFGRQRMGLRYWHLGFVLAALACSSVPQGELATPKSIDDWLTSSCMAKAEVQNYLNEVNRSIYEAWYSSGMRPDQEIVAVFEIAPSGKVVNLRLVSKTPRSAAGRVRAAFREAGPFEPLLGDLECLSYQPMQAILRNPSVPPGQSGTGGYRALDPDQSPP
jgi:hypothetical protein